MKKIIILVVVLVALIGAALYQNKDRKSRLSTGSRKGTDLRALLLPDLDVNSVQKIRVKDAQSEVNVVLNGTTWTVAERGGYEASFEKISRALLALKEQKISKKQIVGKESWAKVGVQPPGGEPNGFGIGTLVELLDAKGNVKKSLILGGNVSSSGNPNASPFGGTNERLIRIPEDGDTLWVIGNTFADLDCKADTWVEKAFFDVQKLKSIEVTAAKPEDSWKASRPDENGDFTLTDAKPGENLDNGKVSLATLLSSPTFNDVLAKDKGAAALKGAVKAKLITFEGFTYNVQAVKQAGKDGAADKYYLAVTVSADIAKERAAVKDEKPEDKKKNDEAFAEEKKKKEEKLAAEKKLEGWVYDVSEYTVNALLKPRAEMLAAPDKKEGGPAGPGAASGLPDIKKMIPGLESAVPPPAFTKPAASPLPETPKVELKPAPAPNANPVTGEKPAAPAPPPDAAKK